MIINFPRKQAAAATVSALSFLSLTASGQQLCKPVSSCTKQAFKPVDLEEYYASTKGLAGQALKAELNAIIRDHRRYSYTPCVWKALEELDEDPENPDNVIAIYTRRSIPKLRRDCGMNDGDSWNREHLWAKSHGFPDQGQHAYTDFHHLVPADRSVNSDRSNKDFMDGGMPHPECTECNEADMSWEAPDSVKGQIARMMFYMAVRYEGDDGSGTPDLELVDRFTGKEPYLGFLADMKMWHCHFPVAERERVRNDKVHSWQGNRNPFIDHPEFVESVWEFKCGEFDDKTEL